MADHIRAPVYCPGKPCSIPNVHPFAPAARYRSLQNALFQLFLYSIHASLVHRASSWRSAAIWTQDGSDPLSKTTFVAALVIFRGRSMMPWVCLHSVHDPLGFTMQPPWETPSFAGAWDTLHLQNQLPFTPLTIRSPISLSMLRQ